MCLHMNAKGVDHLLRARLFHYCGDDPRECYIRLLQD